MSAKTERRLTIQSGSPLSGHSLNDKIFHLSRDLERKAFGRSKKQERSARRMRKEAEEERRQEEFLRGLPDFQFNRALGHMMDGTASAEDINYVAKNIELREEVTGNFSIKRSDNGAEKITPVTITIVDFARSS